MTLVRLLNGRVINLDEVKAARLIRKRRAVLIEATVRPPQQRAVLARPAMGYRP